MEKLVFQKQINEKSSAFGFFENEGTHGFRTTDFLKTYEGMGAANEFARRLVASFNACEGISIETLDNIRVSDAINSMYSAEKRAGIYQKEFERLKAQNAQLLDALQKISGSQADGIEPDDFPGWVDFFQETARGAIAATTQDQ